MNPLNPDRLTASERLDEIAELVAAGFMRLRERKSMSISGDRGESVLDFVPNQRGHASTKAMLEDAQ